ncbi:hypothetical protein P7K49_022040, partial [Saguinus oedipus]
HPGAPPGPALAEPPPPPPPPPAPPPPHPHPHPHPAEAPRSANMAAAAVGRDTLPEHWSYGVCRDGRVFFIKCGAGTRGRGDAAPRAVHLSARSDQLRRTTWLHPRTGEPVNSGHMIRSGGRRAGEAGPGGRAPRRPKFDQTFLAFPQTCPAAGRKASRRRAPATSSSE